MIGGASVNVADLVVIIVDEKKSGFGASAVDSEIVGHGLVLTQKQFRTASPQLEPPELLSSSGHRVLKVTLAEKVDSRHN